MYIKAIAMVCLAMVSANPAPKDGMVTEIPTTKGEEIYPCVPMSASFLEKAKCYSYSAFARSTGLGCGLTKHLNAFDCVHLCAQVSDEECVLGTNSTFTPIKYVRYLPLETHIQPCVPLEASDDELNSCNWKHWYRHFSSARSLYGMFVGTPIVADCVRTAHCQDGYFLGQSKGLKYYFL